MKTRAGMCCLAALALLVIVLVDVGWAGGAPHTMPCGHQGPCLCVPNIRNYGYYPT